jgi:hypothetical protein
MADAALIKRWKTSEKLLKRANSALPRPGKDNELAFLKLEKNFFDFLDHNEHELALDMLEGLGELVTPRGGFWKDMIRASENMGLPARVPYFETQFAKALTKLPETTM